MRRLTPLLTLLVLGCTGVPPAVTPDGATHTPPDCGTLVPVPDSPPPVPTPVQPPVQPPVVDRTQDYWAAVAALVEMRAVAPTSCAVPPADTDDLLALIDCLAADHPLVNADRLAAFRGHNTPLTDRPAWAAALRGERPFPPVQQSTSPFPADQLSVLIVAEGTGPEADELTRLRAWLLTAVPGRWRILDPHLPPTGLAFEEDWVRAAWEVKGASVPWLLIGGPRGGFSGPFQSLSQARDMVEGAR